MNHHRPVRGGVPGMPFSREIELYANDNPIDRVEFAHDSVNGSFPSVRGIR
jgi:hypothetical protein